jgi:uncharacterized repeat protein (TIGR01451 family)
MKKSLVITCASGLMGAALLAAVADESNVPRSSSARSLYFSPSGSESQPEWARPSSSDAADVEQTCADCEETSSEVTTAAAIAPHGEDASTVTHADQQCTAEEADDVTLVQGRSLHHEGDRLYSPISTQSPETHLPSPPPSLSSSLQVETQTDDGFAWADTAPLHEPTVDNPFSLHDSPLSEPTDSQAVPSGLTDSTLETNRPSQFTITQGATQASRRDVSTSHDDANSARECSAPNVELTWRSGGEINVGQETTCLLAVHNCGGADAEQVEVTAFFPASVSLLNAVPEPDHSEDADGGSRLTWSFDRLESGSESVLEVSLIPLARGEIATQAEVRFTSQASGLFAVSEPMLAVNIDGPGSVLVGEPASHVVTVTNPGTGVATHVELEAIIPEGLEHSRGQRLLMDLGSLNPGESRSVRLALAAIRGGNYTVHVQARADASLAQAAACDVSVIAPNLIASIDGPGLRYLGRQAVYTLSVTNDGSVPTDNVRVMHKLPEGFRFVSSDRGAQFDEANSLLNWFVGRLERGQAAQLQVTLEATEAGQFTHFVRATSENGAVSDSQVSTTVEAVSSLALELRDIDDPVELGTEAAYEIQVRNEGTAAASNVAIWCELPAGVEFTSATGPSEHRVEGGVVHFRPLVQLAAGESATFRVLVRASVLGDHRLRAFASSEAASEPLTDEELTKFYGE